MLGSLFRFILMISTHAPLARRDSDFPENDVMERNFYSRASCEARRYFVTETT